MNVNTQPLIQGELIDTRSDDLRSDAHDLIDSISDVQLQSGILTFSSGLPSFTQVGMPETAVKEISVGTSSRPARRSVTEYFFKGKLNRLNGQPIYCSCCGQEMVYNGTTEVDLKHIPMGGIYTHIVVSKQRALCQNKNCPVSTYTEPLDFKAQGHLITAALENYTRDLLRFGLTMKEISIITGLSKNTVKEIDKKRPQELYTVNGEGKCIGMDLQEIALKVVQWLRKRKQFFRVSDMRRKIFDDPYIMAVRSRCLPWRTIRSYKMAGYAIIHER